MNEEQTKAATDRVSEVAAASAQRRASLIILLVAVIVGAGLRFYRLGGEELSRGEAAAWTAAVVPNLRAVYVASKELDPGKAGLYDLLLHLWIGLFGDDVGPMRTFSALLGTLMIPLVFLASREVWLVQDEDESDGGEATLFGAIAALLYACNLRMVTTDRTARMYTLMLVGITAQVFFFLRAARRPGQGNVIAAAACTVLAMASNVLALLFFAAEAVWIAIVWWAQRIRAGGSQINLSRPIVASVLAAAVFAPIGIADTRIAVGALHGGLWQSIEPQSFGWPLHAIRVMTGNAAFWPLLLTAAVGVWLSGIRNRPGLWFILCWLLVPFALIEVASYTVAPMMVERYVFPSLTAFLVLSALGIASLQSDFFRYGLTALILVQSIVHLVHHWRAPDDIQWREAAHFVADIATPGQKVAVLPPNEPLMVLHYYLPSDKRDLVIGAEARLDPTDRVWHLQCGPEPVLIVETAVPQESWPSIKACYPRLLRHFRLVDVRTR